MSETIATLLHAMIPDSELTDLAVSGLALDSRQVKPGDCFIAYPGVQVDGRSYIANAIMQGAVAIFCEKEGAEKIAATVPIFFVEGLKHKISEIASRFYKHPSSAQRIVGVTGTNGKTTVSYLLASAMQLLDQQCGMIGTLGVGTANDITPSDLTTPNAVDLQRQLAEFKHQKIDDVIMEVSSHGIAEGRIHAVTYETAIFTNLTRDHLDYHGDMTTYGEVKRQLFLHPGLQHAVINRDDAFGESLLQSLKDSIAVYGYSLTKPSDDLPTTYVTDIKQSTQGFCTHIVSPWGEGDVHCHLLGRVNISNMLAVLTTLMLSGISWEGALQTVSQLGTVPGRLETMGGDDQPLVVVDYAHTPDALEQVLQTLREHCEGSLWCVVGCGGDRDQGKRPLMAGIAERVSDFVVLTDDNPRSEEPEAIMRDMLAGMLCPWAVDVIHDRHAAIAHAIECAGVNDIVLIAGKGHESVQIIGNEYLPFDDSEQVQMQLALWCKQHGKSSFKKSIYV